ncbi:ribonuclease HII [Facklamia sp. 7083-14-GEN3]|uniref:ribonuclease HII n=1 Tax=Facklamia sp. 7083-14-GEN3 TaxID=2973478 RepID=UPI00215B8235|nr:ribonuclease HII [Facklamia sp. 7083-14-GEN3]MCR8968834.1 ribonuclease HII [Facklamia sp. 7083-14-GEN3]
MKQTIKEIKEQLKNIQDLNDVYLIQLSEDSRKGVQDLLKRHKKMLTAYNERYHAYQERLAFDRQLLSANQSLLLAGTDEVGRGPIAGPVVAAAVILPQDTSNWVEVNDSKSLTHQKRSALAEMIKQQAQAYAITSISPQEIDRINIYEASRMAMKEAVLKLNKPVDFIVVDAMKLDLPIQQKAVVKGDRRSLSIAAASIIAKVHRDQLMMNYAQSYPEYGFDQHMGYPTKKHLSALEKFGYTSIHRLSYGPVQRIDRYYGL